MTVDSIEKIFLHPTLTKIAQDSEKPHYTSIKQLKDEIISNKVAVLSDLGDELNGHLFLVISNYSLSIFKLLRLPPHPLSFSSLCTVRCFCKTR